MPPFRGVLAEERDTIAPQTCLRGLRRFRQVQPKVIFSVNQTVYNAKVHDHLPKLSSLLSGLANDRPKVVVVSALGNDGTRNGEWAESWLTWDAFLDTGKKASVTDTGTEIDWYRGSFDWPLWILFSSGTTSKRTRFVVY